MLSQEVVHFQALRRFRLGLMGGSRHRHFFLSYTLSFGTATCRGVRLDFGCSRLSAMDSVLRQTILDAFSGSLPPLHCCSKPAKLDP